MRDRKELIKHYKENGVGAEIGVLFGEFSRETLQLWDGKLYMVDIWNDTDFGYIDNNNHIHYEKNLPILKTLENLRGLEDRGIMIRASSKQASLLFQDNSLDFVHIDANHSYESTKEDIELWYPKIKDGGIFSIHDYILYPSYAESQYEKNGKDKLYMNSLFGVNKAVDEFCFKNKISKNITTNESFATFYCYKINLKNMI
jgi:hypothetical protein